MSEDVWLWAKHWTGVWMCAACGVLVSSSFQERSLIGFPSSSPGLVSTGMNRTWWTGFTLNMCCLALTYLSLHYIWFEEWVRYLFCLNEMQWCVNLLGVFSILITGMVSRACCWWYVHWRRQYSVDLMCLETFLATSALISEQLMLCKADEYYGFSADIQRACFLVVRDKSRMHWSLFEY